MFKFVAEMRNMSQKCDTSRDTWQIRNKIGQSVFIMLHASVEKVFLQNKLCSGIAGIGNCNVNVLYSGKYGMKVT